MDGKLSLDRDFTRFFDDPTFPHKVTVCVGDKRMVCSGALLAQQSSVLEKKFREDDGVLMFEELLDVNNTDGVMECIRYLHGANVQFIIKTLPIVIKFSSFYKVEDLFEKAIKWLEDYLDNSKSVKHALNFLKVSNFLDGDYSAKIKTVICRFIKLNEDLFGTLCVKFLDTEISGHDILLILNERPTNSHAILTKWTAMSLTNKTFIARNHDVIDFNHIFHDAELFLLFMTTLSSGVTSTDMMKNLIDLCTNIFF